MKVVFALVAIFISFSLFAGLKSEKVAEAIIKAQLHRGQDKLNYSLSDDPDLREKVVKLNETTPLKTYGPYFLTLKDVQPGTRFGLYTFNLLGVYNPPFVCSGYIDQNGEAWTKQKNGDVKLSEFLLYIGNTLPGEPIHSIVVLDDRKTYIAACAIPEPLEAFGKNGRHVAMELFTSRIAQYAVYGEHFESGEVIALSVCSKSGTATKYLKASEDGTFFTVLEGNGSRGQLQAEMLQVYSAEQIEPLTISYDWRFLEASSLKGIWKRYVR